jgi:DNA mismatch repair protein MutL
VSEIIQLLPDHLANQIAAGEVIQRPASAVKELIENAIDAGATEIQLIIKDAGKELIQVVDNGKGMSALDARMCFERHATSKIRKIEDLFSIKTMGFRGEALASIAAVAQVELKTKSADDELGTYILIEGSQVKIQEPIATPNGTSIAIKNLFYNVPARRKFLKSNTTEFKNIVDEFTRIVLTYPHIGFKLFHNGVEQMHLSSGNLKARITNTLGNRYEKQLIPIEELIDGYRIYGYIGKPESANKTRGNQYFFVNNRFIKSPYLHHAVVKAFEGLIEKDTHPFYTIYFELDPEKVDVNVHPTKQEVKFEDEQILYAYLNSAVKRSLSVHNIAPAIDFTLNPEIINLDAVKLPTSERDIAKANDSYLSKSFSQPGRAHFIDSKEDWQDWKTQKEQLYDPWAKFDNDLGSSKPTALNPSYKSNVVPSRFMQHNIDIETGEVIETQKEVFGAQMETEHFSQGVNNMVLQWDEFLITTMKSGMLLIHKKRALERIAYEKLKRRYENSHAISQALLFPTALELSPSDAVILDNILDDLHKLGFEISKVGNNNYSIDGAPIDVTDGREIKILEEIIAQLHYTNNAGIQTSIQEQIIQSMAKRMAIMDNKLEKEEAAALIDELFACQMPNYSPDGYTTFTLLPKDSLLQLL